VQFVHLLLSPFLGRKSHERLSQGCKKTDAARLASVQRRAACSPGRANRIPGASLFSGARTQETHANTDQRSNSNQHANAGAPSMLVPAPAVPGYGARLLAIAGSSDNDIWAVGWFDENNARHNLALHWNGLAWERVPVPDVVPDRINALNGVAVIAPNDVWAVGYAVDLSYRTVTLHWNGSAWQVVPSPNLTRPGSYNALNAVVAISSNDVWAVGGVPIGLGVPEGRALLMHWDGSAWQLFPEPPEVVNWYTTSRFGVAARASNDV
jgi:hypothetical protein